MNYLLQSIQMNLKMFEDNLFHYLFSFSTCWMSIWCLDKCKERLESTDEKEERSLKSINE